MAKLEYVHELLVKAVATLAAHPGAIRERLMAVRAELHGIESDDLPDELRAEWVHLDSYLGILDGQSDETLPETAYRIVGLKDRVDTYLRERGG